jgi:ABC-type xylose transport system substrate-binding protein
MTRRPSTMLSRLAAGAAIAALALTGCSAKNSGDTASEGDHGQGRVAFMMPDLITPRWDAQDKLVFEEEAKQACPDCEVTYYNAKGDAGTQLSQVQAAIANGVDVIVLAPTDKTAAVNMVNLAHDAGVKVISYATNIDSPNVDYIVTTDVPKIGAQQAQSLIDVYAANDDLAGGVIAAMKNAGIDPSTRLVTGQDGSKAGLQRVIAGEQYNTINLPIKVFAAKTADLAVALAQGEEAPADIINGTGETPSGDEIPAYLYPTEVITVENVGNMIEPKGFWKLSDICTPEYQAACQKAGLQ